MRDVLILLGALGAGLVAFSGGESRRTQVGFLLFVIGLSALVF